MCDHDGMCICAEETTPVPTLSEKKMEKDMRRFLRFLNPDIYNWFLYIACKAAVVNYNDAVGHLVAFEELFARRELTDEQFALLEKLHENCYHSEQNLMVYLQRNGFRF